ncbi:MAG: hypothetical protein Q4G69_10335 [Planctomycetia bacterium]|nr:hypothetical protein [Planctomycetia bacterium]
MKNIFERSAFCLSFFLTAFFAFSFLSDLNAAESSVLLHTQYIRALEPWIKAANKEVRHLDKDLAIYGLAQHGHWYMQAHDTAFCAYAVLGTDPETDESRTGMSKADLRKTALAMLRFTLRSHLAGGSVCTDGLPWGHTWISQLGLERMSAGVDAIEPYMDSELRGLYAKVYASEADYILTLPVVAGLTKNNVPESNMWKGAALFRASVLNPKHKNAARWKEAACKHFINSMSTPSDKTNDLVIDGKKVRDRFVGANMFDSRACNHHGYQNVGYMNITLSNLALLHFWCKKRDVEPPMSLYFNALAQWEVVKACTFNDGRLLRVGGDTRIRYCYCQDYAIFCWMLARDRFGDADTAAFERGWLNQVFTEQKDNPTGWYMFNRLEDLWNASPLYFTRIEGDKACSLASAAYWHRIFDFEKMSVKKVIAPKSWHDDFHGAWLQKGKNRIASWVWKGALKAGGLCIPSDGSDMAEWQCNLAGQILGTGMKNICSPITWTGFSFEGGFATCGASKITSSESLAEGTHTPGIGTLFLAFCALPDDRTVVAVQRAESITSNYLRRVRGLALSVPNDVFNHFERTVYLPNGVQKLKAMPKKYELLENKGKWLNIDNKLGVVEIYGGTPKIARLADRQVMIQNQGKPKAAGGNLYCEEIAQVCSEGISFIREKSTIFDCAAVVLTANADATKKFADQAAAKSISSSDSDLRLLKVLGADRNLYFIAVNFSDKEKTFDPMKVFKGKDLISLGQFADVLPARGIALWKQGK